MPKVVDHEVRRNQVATALWKVVGKHGLESATIRKVAEQAEMSIGLVQHYFKSKEELELFALDQMLTAAQHRIERRFEAMEQPASARAVICTLLAELMIPADKQRLAEYQVVLSYSLRSMHVQHLADSLRASNDGLRDLLTEELLRGQVEGDVPKNLKPEVEAIVLLCFADGCGQRILMGQMQHEQGLKALDHLLDRLFTASPNEVAPSSLTCNTEHLTD